MPNIFAFGDRLPTALEALKIAWTLVKEDDLIVGIINTILGRLKNSAETDIVLRVEDAE